MKKLNTLLEHKFVKDHLTQLCKDKSNAYISIMQAHIDLDIHTLSSKKRKANALFDILINNEDFYENKYLKYQSAKSVIERLSIKYGSDVTNAYTDKLKRRPTPKNFSILTVDFWVLRRGYTEQEAKLKISEIQKGNSLKCKAKRVKNKNYGRDTCKHSLKYWEHKGYNKEESEILREPFLRDMKNDLNSLQLKYGETDGYNKWKASKLKSIATQFSGGSVSKESIRFFIPLYKFCRRLGIPKEKIYFGIKGSREFFIKDMNISHNGGKFYDFTISSIKTVIEYHGCFWHPRNDIEWKNPWMSLAEATKSDIHREVLAKNAGMDYNIVWSDDNLSNRLEELKILIKEKWNGRV